jgi:hypothetical protein
MDMMKIASLRQPTQLESFERSLVELARSEMQKTAAESSEALADIGGGARTPHLDRFMQQTKLAVSMGRELAKEAGVATSLMGKAVGAIKPIAGKAMGYAALHPQQAMAAGGAAVGAVGGAMAGGPGNRMSGALGGAAMGGAAGYGASKIPGGMGQKLTQGVRDAGFRGYQAMGSPKLAFAGGKAGLIGAAVGGIGGALHQSGAERQGLESGHHLRNALMGAAGGAALGAGASKLPAAAAGASARMKGMGMAAEGAAARGAQSAGHNPYLSKGTPVPAGWGHSYTPTEIGQMNRVKANANSTMASVNRGARADAAMGRPQRPAPGVMGANRPPAQGAPQPPRPLSMDVSTSAGGRVKPAMTGYEPTMAKAAGANFIKWAMSMSAQAEPGTPSGAQDPETDSQLIPEKPRPISKPAKELYDSLRHLSPKSMRGLQQAQPGS